MACGRRQLVTALPSDPITTNIGGGANSGDASACAGANNACVRDSSAAH